MNQQSQRYFIENKEIQEEKLLSEGGYGYIWRAFDTRTRQVYALKKMICQGSERIQVAQNELNILKRLPNHPNLVNYFGSLVQKQSEERQIFFILMEFCSGGSLFDMMAKDPNARFPESLILTILNDVVQGIKAMHSIQLAHRDIKIENILFQNGKYKLCDFGSASSERVDFAFIDKNEFYKYEEFYEKNTTLMYRPPEMADLFQRYQVNEKVDIWMLGCVIFTLCFFIHPFAESQKLAIVNAAYNIPKNSKYSNKLIDLIRLMLTPNPKLRPSIIDIEKIVRNWDSIQSIQLNVNAQAQEIKNKHIQMDKEMEQYEKNIKKFDGDIPMDELLKLQQKIRQEQEQQESQDKQYSQMGRGLPKQKRPPQQQNVQQQSKQPNNNFGNFGSTNTMVIQYVFNFQKSNNQQWGFGTEPIVNKQQQFSQFGDQQWGQNQTSAQKQDFWNWNEPASKTQSQSNPFGVWDNQTNQTQQNQWAMGVQQQPNQTTIPQQDFGWGTANIKSSPEPQNAWGQQGQGGNQQQSQHQYNSAPIWSQQQQSVQTNQQWGQPLQLQQQQSMPNSLQQFGFQQVAPLAQQQQQKQPDVIDLIGLEEGKKGNQIVDLSNIII